MQQSAQRPPIDTSAPYTARMFNYLLGGDVNYPVDREAAEKVIAASPGVAKVARSNRRWVDRVVRYLAAEAGIRQFLDIGSALPPLSTYDVATEASGGERVTVAYVDNDVSVLAHADTLLREGRTSVSLGDLRRPREILDSPEVTSVLDLSEPVGVIIAGVFHFVPDSDDPLGVLATLRAALAPGSHIAISHATADIRPERATGAQGSYTNHPGQNVLRSRAELLPFFDGLELVEPGLVPVPEWRPDGAIPADSADVWLYAGVGRLP